jgi:protein TonB
MIAALLLGLQSQAQLPALQAPAPVPSDHVTPPRQIYMPPVASYYPPEAMEKGEQGVTQLKCLLDITGRLVDCGVRTSSGSAALDAAAFRIAQDARYEPQKRGGQPVAILAIFPVRWVLAE